MSGKGREGGGGYWVSVNMCAQDTLTKLAQQGVQPKEDTADIYFSHVRQRVNSRRGRKVR